MYYYYYLFHFFIVLQKKKKYISSVLWPLDKHYLQVGLKEMGYVHVTGVLDRDT